MSGSLAANFTGILFRAAAGICTACFLVLVGFLAAVTRRAAGARARAAASGAIRPGLGDSLVEFVAGAADDSRFREAMVTHAKDVEECILLFQGAVGGSARDRLCRLTLDLGLVHQWCERSRSRDVAVRRAAVSRLGYACVYEPCRRLAGDVLVSALEDADEEVRLSACRGLALFGGTQELRRLFTLSLGPNRMLRTVLAEDLRPHAMTLAGKTLHEVLREGDATRVAAALEILVAWERAIPMENLSEVMGHHDAAVRLLAFRLAAFIPADKEIRALAIIAMGRQKMKDGLPELAACLRREDLELARHAAAALAAMPPEGWQTLEELSESTSETTARAAGEALERMRMMGTAGA
jgi:hypothetical protein